MTIEQVPQTVTEQAVDDLTDMLVEEVFEHAERFTRANGDLNHYAIFNWLAQIQDSQGLVSEATVGTAGSRWLLARKLGETLDAVIDQIMQKSAVERAMQDMANVFMLGSMMNVWRLNDELVGKPIRDDGMNIGKMSGHE